MKRSAHTLVIALLFTASASGPLHSQETEALTLKECIEIALTNNSLLRNAERRVGLVGTYQTQARASLLPRINTSLSSGKFIQGARVLKYDVPTGQIDPATGGVIYEQREIFQDRTERNSHSASISLQQNIFDFGRSINGLKQANASKEAAHYDMISTRRSVIMEVKGAYYELLKTHRLQEVYREAVALGEEQVNRAQTKMDIGLASQADVYQALVVLGANRQNLITQENLVEIAKANLNNTLGRDPGTALKIIEDRSEPIFPDYPFDEAIETALSNNEGIKALEMQTRANRHAINVAKGAFLPSIGASISYNRTNDDIGRVYTSELDRDFSATLGIGLNLNIFNGFADKAAVQREQINYQMAVEDLADGKRQLIADVKRYFLQLAAYKEILDINRQNIEAARENLRLQQEKRRVGSGTELDVSEAQVQLIEAQSTFVRAEYDAKIARAQLETVLGLESE